MKLAASQMRQIDDPQFQLSVELCANLAFVLLVFLQSASSALVCLHVLFLRAVGRLICHDTSSEIHFHLSVDGGEVVCLKSFMVRIQISQLRVRLLKCLN